MKKEYSPLPCQKAVDFRRLSCGIHSRSSLSFTLCPRRFSTFARVGARGRESHFPSVIIKSTSLVARSSRLSSSTGRHRRSCSRRPKSHVRVEISPPVFFEYAPQVPENRGPRLPLKVGPPPILGATGRCHFCSSELSSRCTLDGRV